LVSQSPPPPSPPQKNSEIFPAKFLAKNITLFRLSAIVILDLLKGLQKKKVSWTAERVLYHKINNDRVEMAIAKALRGFCVCFVFDESISPPI